jgi:hypothetical protein
MRLFTGSPLFTPWYMEHIAFLNQSTHLTSFVFECLLNNPSTEPKLTTKTEQCVARVWTVAHNTSYALFHSFNNPSATHTHGISKKHALYLTAYITLFYSISWTYYTVKLYHTGLQHLLYPYILLNHMYISTVQVEFSNLITIVNNPLCTM